MENTIWEPFGHVFGSIYSPSCSLRPTSEDMSAQVRTIDATYRSIEGGVGVLRNQAQSLAKDAANLLKVYGAGLSVMVRWSNDVLDVLLRSARQTLRVFGTLRQTNR